MAAQPSPTRAGTPALKIPAFSAAISSTVSPKILVWSSLIHICQRKETKRADHCVHVVEATAKRVTIKLRARVHKKTYILPGYLCNSGGVFGAQINGACLQRVR